MQTIRNVLIIILLPLFCYVVINGDIPWYNNAPTNSASAPRNITTNHALRLVHAQSFFARLAASENAYHNRRVKPRDYFAARARLAAGYVDTVRPGICRDALQNAASVANTLAAAYTPPFDRIKTDTYKRAQPGHRPAFLRAVRLCMPEDYSKRTRRQLRRK